MKENIFKIIFLALWVIFILIRAPFDKKRQNAEKGKTTFMPSERTLLILLSIGLMLIPFIWVFTPFLNQFNMMLPLWLRITGIGISILSLVYFWWVHYTLGANWSPTLEIREEHELIKTGPYKRIRHPMYAQTWLWCIAQALIISNFIAGFSGLIAWALLYFIRVPKEEKLMIDKFGNEYVQYMKETGSVLPKISGSKK